MSKYADFLREQGASEEDIKVLDTPIAQKAFDAQQAAATAAINDYKQKADDWYEKVATPNLTKAQQEATKAQAEAARLRALVVSSTDEALKAVAADMGYKLDGSAAPKKDDPPAIDSRYVTTESILNMADNVGDNLAHMQDAVLEHMQLFPGQRLNVAALRKEAVANRKGFYEYWEQKYKVPDAREAQSKAAREAHEATIRKEEREKVTAELASQYGNPNTIPSSPSTNVFVPRPSTGREKAPWETGFDGQNGAGDRTARAAKNYIERQGTRTN